MSSWYAHVLSVLTTIVVSSVLRRYEDAAHTRPRQDHDGPLSARRDSLHLIRIQRSSNINDTNECQEEGPAYCPPPLYQSTTTPHSAYVLPSIPLRKRDMNKHGLTVFTDIPVSPPFEFRPLEMEPREHQRVRELGV